jgi:CBS domain-containing protein
MQISECMTRDVRTIAPGKSLCDAAKMMADMDAGALPVGENDRLVGMITDRDIAVRAVAAGKGPETLVRESMSAEVRYCFEDDEIESVARNMGQQQLRRLPVLNKDKRLVGIVSLGDLACSDERSEVVGETLENISRTGGAHSQSAEAQQH